MNFDVEATRLNDAFKEIGPGFSAKFCPAEDESVGDQISVLRDGVDTGFSLQFGHGYVGANHWDEADQSLLDIYCGRSVSAARAKLVEAVTKHFA